MNTNPPSFLKNLRIYKEMQRYEAKNPVQKVLSETAGEVVKLVFTYDGYKRIIITEPDKDALKHL